MLIFLPFDYILISNIINHYKIFLYGLYSHILNMEQNHLRLLLIDLIMLTPKNYRVIHINVSDSDRTNLSKTMVIILLTSFQNSKLAKYTSQIKNILTEIQK